MAEVPLAHVSTESCPPTSDCNDSSNIREREAGQKLSHLRPYLAREPFALPLGEEQLTEDHQADEPLT